MKPIIYISGPYSAATAMQRQKNVHRAAERYIDTLKSGEWWAICPHTMTNEMEIHVPEMPHEEWIASDICLLAKCDAIWADYLKNKRSVGTRLELAWAILAGMPIHLGNWVPLAPNMLKNNRRRDLMEPIYEELAEDREKIFSMAADGKIPDPVYYKGSMLLTGSQPWEIDPRSVGND